MRTSLKVGLVAAFALVVGLTTSAQAALNLPTMQCSYSFPSSMGLGARGSSVMDLQKVLNMYPETRVASTGAGSPGMETSYFGPATRAAVIKFQAINQVSPTSGFVGALTRAVLNQVCSGTSANLPVGCTSTSGFSPVTGQACNTGGAVTLPVGCTSTSGFSSVTGQSCAGGATTTIGPVTASLAANNPASGVLVAGQATADLAHFAFAGTGTVTSVTLQRIGVSADSTLSNVYLFDGATRLTDAASVTNGGAITFTSPTGLFSVNGSKIISVKSDIASGTNGQTVGVRLVSYMVSGTATTISANISGNQHAIATATLAGVAAGTVTPSGSTINPGPAQTLWQSTLSITQRDVWLKRIAFRQIGSAPASALTNFKLFVNGVQVGNVVPSMDSMSYVTFDLSSNPVALAAGSRLVRVEADVVSGSSRTVQLSLRQASDVDFVDKDYGVNITPTSTPWVASSAITISGSTGGSMIVQKDTSLASGDITADATDVTLGRFTFQAFGETIKLETIKAAFYSSDATIDSLRNGRVLVNGVQYGSTATLVTCDTSNDGACNGSDTSGTGTSFTLNYNVPAGQSAIVEIHADAYDNDGTNGISNNDTLIGAIAVGSSNALKQDSLGYLSTPEAIVTGQTMTVKTASATLTKDSSYANQTINIPQTSYKLGDWNVSAGTAEDLNVNTVAVDIAAVSGSTFTVLDLTNVYVKVGNTMSTIYPTVSATGNSFSLSQVTVPKGTSVPVELYANILSGGITSTNSIRATATVSGNSAVSGTSVSTSAVAGQTIAYGTGTLTISLDGSSPLNMIAAGNQEVTAGTFKFQAASDNFTVQEVDVSVPAAAISAVSTVKLFDGATMVASQSFTGNDGDSGSGNMASFTGLNWVVPTNTTKVLTVKLVLNTIGTGAGTSQQNAVVQLDRVRYQDSAGSVTTYTTDVTANELYVYKSIPTIVCGTGVTCVAGGDGTLTNGQEKKVYEFTVNANASGPISIKQFKLAAALTDVVGTNNTLQMDSWKLYENGVDVTSSVTIRADGGASIESTSGFAEASTTVIVGWDSALESTIAAGTSKTYALYATPDGFLNPSDNDAFSIYFAGDASHNGSSTFLNAGNSDDIVALFTSATPAESGATAANFIWSDNSSNAHSASIGASSSADWANGYKVLNLNLGASAFNN